MGGYNQFHAQWRSISCSLNEFEPHPGGPWYKYYVGWPITVSSPKVAFISEKFSEHVLGDLQVHIDGTVYIKSSTHDSYPSDEFGFDLFMLAYNNA